MKNAQEITDKFAIGLSMLCTIHCLLVPILLVLLPSLGALQLDNEAFHTWMLIGVIPTSLYALTMGCKTHGRYLLLVLGGAGLILLTLAAVLGHEIVGEYGEKVLTVMGTTLVVLAHLSNFRHCKKQKECPCSNEPK